MNMQQYPVWEGLEQYVSAITYMEAGAEKQGTPGFRVLPDVCIELFVNCGSDSAPFSVNGTKVTARSFITSRMSRYMDVRRVGDVAFVSVWFYPGKAWPFFEVPMSDLTNQIVCLQELWGPKADDMETQMMAARTQQERIAILGSFLLSCLRGAPKAENWFVFSQGYISQFKGQQRLDDVARAAGVSNRQLTRKFDQLLGLSPKEYSRMSRFLYSLSLLKAGHLSLTEVAYEAGYFDQAHFIHEVRNFSGLTPGDLTRPGPVLF